MSSESLSSASAPSMSEVRTAVTDLASGWREQTAARRVRLALDPADLRALAATGYTRIGVEAARGGLWRGLRESVRDLAVLTETLAQVDPSLALVTSMHPLVLAYWLECRPQAGEAQPFEAQSARFQASAAAGDFWGTITSEPGSGGDIYRTRAVLGHGAGGVRTLTGEKHFGSGSGACRYMVTTARIDADSEPTVAVIDMTDVDPLNPPPGITLRRQWDGFGMMATQSHALAFDAFEVEPHAAPLGCMGARTTTSQLSAVLFSAVAIALLEEALDGARKMLAGRRQGMRPFERVTWVDVENRGWLARQAFDGMISAVEQDRGLVATLRGKQAIADLAETALLDLGRVLGGASFSRSQTFGQSLQDVRALGFLRPPWGLADDTLFDAGFPQ